DRVSSAPHDLEPDLCSLRLRAHDDRHERKLDQRVGEDDAREGVGSFIPPRGIVPHERSQGPKSRVSWFLKSLSRASVKSLLSGKTRSVNSFYRLHEEG